MDTKRRIEAIQSILRHFDGLTLNQAEALIEDVRWALKQATVSTGVDAEEFRNARCTSMEALRSEKGEDAK